MTTHPYDYVPELSEPDDDDDRQFGNCPVDWPEPHRMTIEGGSLFSCEREHSPALIAGLFGARDEHEWDVVLDLHARLVANRPPPAPPMGRHPTDTGNAQRLVDRHGHDLRYVAEHKQWLVWDGSRWRPDSLGRVMELAKETVLSIYDEARNADDDLRPKLAKWAVTSENASHVKMMVTLAHTNPAVAIEAKDLDRHVWLLNCTNGTLDLRTGELREPSRDDLLTKTTGVAYNPEAACPQWERFVSWALGDRPEVVEFVQRALGYSLSGDVSERLLFFLHGEGANGKSTLLDVFQHVLGDYSLRVAASLFGQSRFADASSPRPELVRLKGARFITSSEMEDGTKLATALVKEMTGNETMAARGLHQAPIEFRPEFKPWIAANHKPSVPADDQAIWDRMRLIPFDVRVSEEEKDRQLGRKLKVEAEGILAWAVRGSLAWQGHGLHAPEAVTMATESYRTEMDMTDVLNAFIDWVDEYGEDVDYSPEAFRTTYNGWAEQNPPAPVLSARDFPRKLRAYGFDQAKGTGGKRVWVPPGQVVRVPVNYAALIERYKHLLVA